MLGTFKFVSSTRKKLSWFSSLLNLISSWGSRPVMGTGGYSLKVSIMHLSIYFISNVSSNVHGLSESPNICSSSSTTFSYNNKGELRGKKKIWSQMHFYSGDKGFLSPLSQNVVFTSQVWLSSLVPIFQRVRRSESVVFKRGQVHSLVIACPVMQAN